MSGRTVRIECPSCSSSLSVKRDGENPFFQCARCGHFFEVVEKRSPVVVGHDVRMDTTDLRVAPLPTQDQQPIEFVDDPRPRPRRWGCAIACVLTMAISFGIAVVGSTRVSGPYSHALVEFDDATSASSERSIALKFRDGPDLTVQIETVDPARRRFVHSVDLSGTRVTAEHIELLLQWRNIRELDLSNTQITNYCVDRICINFDHLTKLKLNGTPITDNGLSQLPAASQLEYLDLSNTPITNIGLSPLQTLKKLRFLYLNQTKVANEGLLFLRDIDSLEVLSLQGTQVGDDDLGYLAGLASLFYLNLGETKVSDQGLLLLMNLPELRTINVRETAVTESVAKRLNQQRNSKSIFYTTSF